MNTYIETIHNKKSKINLDEDLHNIEFKKWLNNSKKLQEMTR